VGADVGIGLHRPALPVRDPRAADEIHGVPNALPDKLLVGQLTPPTRGADGGNLTAAMALFKNWTLQIGPRRFATDNRCRPWSRQSFRTSFNEAVAQHHGWRLSFRSAPGKVAALTAENPLKSDGAEASPAKLLDVINARLWHFAADNADCSKLRRTSAISF
jgi:hypothetical protein